MLVLNFILALFTEIKVRALRAFIPDTNYRNDRTTFTLYSLMCHRIFNKRFGLLTIFYLLLQAR